MDWIQISTFDTMYLVYEKRGKNCKLSIEKSFCKCRFSIQQRENYFKKLFSNDSKNRRFPKYDSDFRDDYTFQKEIPESWKLCHLGEIILHLSDYHSNAGYKLLKNNVELFDEKNYAFMIRATNFEKNDFSTNMKSNSFRTH